MIDCLAATVVLSFWTPWGLHGIPTKPLILTHASGAVRVQAVDSVTPLQKEGGWYLSRSLGVKRQYRAINLKPGNPTKSCACWNKNGLISCMVALLSTLWYCTREKAEALIFKLHRTTIFRNCEKGIHSVLLSLLIAVLSSLAKIYFRVHVNRLSATLYITLATLYLYTGQAKFRPHRLSPRRNFQLIM